MLMISELGESEGCILLGIISKLGLIFMSKFTVYGGRMA